MGLRLAHDSGPRGDFSCCAGNLQKFYSHFGVQDVGLVFLPKLRVCTMLPDTSVGSVGFRFEALACRTVDVESLPVYSVCACLYDCAGVLVHAHGHDEIKKVL